jgi:glycosyltransferase involved in cell wall biosynthesis
VLLVSFSPERIDDARMEFVGVEPFEKYKNKHLFVTRARRIRACLREWRPDVVFATYVSSNGLSAALAWRGPLVVSARGSDVLGSATGPGPGCCVRRQIVRYVCRRANAVHGVSETLEEARRGFGGAGEKLHRCPVGVDVERFRPAADMVREEAVRLICTRKHEPIYDMVTILKALGQLKAKGRHFHCTFVGGGHLIEAHRRMAGELGLAEMVTMMGHLPHEALPEQLREADVYVSAALSDGTSSSLLEAMATGLFPVVTGIDANRPWIRDGQTGLLFKAGDADLLARALERAMNDAALRRRGFAENRELVEHEGVQQKNNERLAGLLERVVRERGGR